MSLPQEISAQGWEAMRRFVERCTIPLMGDHEGPHAIYGTGTLYASHGRRFFVTAAHVIDGIPLERMVIPIGEHGEVLRLGKGRAAWTKVAGTDVAAIELTDSTMLGTLESAGHRRFLTKENVVLHPPSGSQYLLLGYPAVGARETDRELFGRATWVATDAYNGPLDTVPDVTPTVTDLLLTWQHAAKLHGISGCPIWIIEKGVDPEELWTAEKSLKLVAVQKGAAPKVWIRGTRWAQVDHVIKTMVS